jgi:signal transduction histidine kinase
MQKEETKLQFVEEIRKERENCAQDKWIILVVDDEEEIHAVTNMVLKDLVYDGRKFELIHAYSAMETKSILNRQEGIAVILLDVVMETEDAGLRLIPFIREELKNDAIRIIIRTGQPGQAPEEKVVLQYDINDYKAKTELSAQKLVTTIITAFRSYENIRLLNRKNSELLRLMGFKYEFFNQYSQYFQPKIKEVAVNLGQLLTSPGLPDQPRNNLEQATQKIDGLVASAKKVFDIELLENAVEARYSEIVNLEELLSELSNIHADSIRKKRLKIRIDLDSTAKAYRSNRTIMKILFNELFFNAIIYNREDGFIHFRGWTEGEFLIFSIEDSGIGVRTENQGRIFEQFYRTAESTRINPYGAGLGLFMVKKCLEYYGGTIKIESRHQEGSCFTFRMLRQQ